MTAEENYKLLVTLALMFSKIIRKSFKLLKKSNLHRVWKKVAH